MVFYGNESDKKKLNTRTNEKSQNWQLQTKITSGAKKFSDYREITKSKID